MTNIHIMKLNILITLTMDIALLLIMLIGLLCLGVTIHPTFFLVAPLIP